MDTVRKKQMIMSRAMITMKMKLERVSNPSHLEKEVSGSGKIAMMTKITGSRSQARELLMDIEFFLRLRTIKTKRTSAAMDISI
ncbi:MAG: hypothetical protein Q4C24_00400 [Candidatus Saccharibacteria bacterium]|nr:hypothetical protein [Candidatus Saccharibacteria bacterium]